ncbi:GNAT family N-acetyltransferase [Apilactobacillus apisilvae]|uniref:GNAT family N-acetyltransferase n=1 Tax=Apilactobacillus apisilvae TaxID=2923364 RepID=A0ABY4PJ47_9LACO|nr:GNAT family N-acetyltransferase [Apilactobacillus apisilvae]UQS85658.1 GNAT family N-acetyltransferase [Apilactobacillus apisilvae]
MLMRRAHIEDLNAIKQIIFEGKELLSKQGVNQWQDGYPNTDSLINDIRNQWTVVLEENGEILGTAAVIPGTDDSYENLDGIWLSNGPYVSIHRVAVSNHHHGRGLSQKLFEAIYDVVKNVNGINSIRVDTNPDNLGMQHVIKKAGFIETGKVVPISATQNTKIRNYAYERLIKQPLLV